MWNRRDAWGGPGVLVVDDDVGMRESLQAMLELVGFQVWQAGDAEEALICVERMGPRFIVLDADLGGCRGETVASLLRQREGANVYILGISTEDRKESMLLAGASAFLEKPFDPEVLIQWLREAAALAVIRGGEPPGGWKFLGRAK